MSSSSRPSPTTAQRRSRTVACSSSARPPPACRSPPRCSAPGARSSSRSASTCGCRAPTAAATSCGGWTPPASGTSATTRSTTSPARAASPRRSCSGTPDRATLDLNALTAAGVELVGRWASVRDGKALFSGGLRNVIALADLKQQRMLAGFDAWAAAAGRRRTGRRAAAPDGGADVTALADRPAQRRDPHDHLGDRLPARLRLARRAGARRARAGSATTGGRSRAPGLYALGLPVLRRRKSTFIHGIEDDAREVIADLAAHLGA